MTKEELVRQAAKCLPSKVTTVKEEKAFIDSFVRGAEWMQAMMQESNEGQALLYAVKKTAERTKREVVQEAVEWLDNNVDKYCFNSGGKFEYIPKVGRKMLEDFKQAMQDERDF